MIKKYKTEDVLDAILRRLTAIEKRMDILDSDRQIFETIQGRLTQLEEEWKLTRNAIHSNTKDIKEEVQLANDKVVASVETQVETITDAIETKRVIPKKKVWWKLIFKR